MCTVTGIGIGIGLPSEQNIPSEFELINNSMSGQLKLKEDYSVHSN